MDKRTINVLVFLTSEIVCGLYLLWLSSWNGLEWLLPAGIVILFLGAGLLTRKKIIKVINIAFSTTLLLAYFVILSDLLIRRGFIKNLDDPFLLMGFVMHFPAIVFNIIAIIFLTRKQISEQFN